VRGDDDAEPGRRHGESNRGTSLEVPLSHRV
jgi:hypothetical protein